MKKIIALLLCAFIVCVSVASCGSEGKDTSDTSTLSEPKDDSETASADNNSTDNDSADSSEYEYTYRDLPEAKYLTAASGFAGGTGTEADPYQIADAAQLALLSEKSLSDDSLNYSSAYYVLTSDITINNTDNFDSWATAAPEYQWKPIDGFSGVFDGKGYTVSGIYINTNCTDSNDNAYGLFGSASGVIKNITVDKAYIAVSGLSSYIGSIAGYFLGDNEDVIENCTSNAVIEGYEGSIGGIVGNANAKHPETLPTVKNCSFSGKFTQRKFSFVNFGGIIGDSEINVQSCTSSGTAETAGDNVDSVGGIIGRVSGGTVDGCTNSMSIKTSKTETSTSAIGGIVGKIFVMRFGSDDLTARGATVKNCINNGEIEGQFYVGGIAGLVNNDRNDWCVTVSDCENNGKVSGNNADCKVGGIIGSYRICSLNGDGNKGLVENCVNNADITTGVGGGIISEYFCTEGTVTIRNCNNKANISSEGQYVGGIVAYWKNNEKSAVTLENCDNSGKLSSQIYAGGIVGSMDLPVLTGTDGSASVTVKDCDNSGDVTVSSINGYVGGVLGNWGVQNTPTTIENCTNSGKLTITHTLSDDYLEEEGMTLSRVIGGIIGRVGSGLTLTVDSNEEKLENIQSENALLTISNCKNNGAYELADDRTSEIYKNFLGGIVGFASGDDNYSFRADNCSYTGFDRGLGNDLDIDIGTKN